MQAWKLYGSGKAGAHNFPKMKGVINMKTANHYLRRGAALLLAGCTAAMTACAKTNSSQANSEPASTSAIGSTAEKTYEKEITIDLFTETGNYNGEVPGWGAKLYKDKFNMKVNIISPQGDEAVYQTRAISGNLGDLAIFGTDMHFRDSIDAGLIMDLNKDNLFAERGKDIEKYQDAIQFMKDTYGGGTALYGLPNQISERSPLTTSEASEITFGSFLRFDIYQDIGAPEIKTLDELYPTLKKMAEAHPTADNGEKVYAFSLFGDWDGTLMTFAKQFGCMYGYEEISGGRSYILQNNDASDYYSVFEPDSYYVKGLKIYNQAYRDGLLDPDSMTQNFQNVSDKLRDGQVLYSCWSWLAESYNSVENTSAGKAMMFVPITDEKVAANGCRNIGGSYRISIGANAQDPERMMDFINWMYTTESLMMFNNGPEGLTWEMKDGKPTLTEYGYKVVPTNTKDAVPDEYGGGTWQEGTPVYWNSVLYTDTNPEINQSYTWRVWDSYLDSHSAANDVKWTAYENWSKFYGVKTQKEYLEKNNQLSVYPGTSLIAPELDSDLTQIQGQIQPIVREYSWKMVYAKDDAEFDSLLKEMAEKCKGLGVDKLDDFYKAYLKELNAECEKVIAQYKN